MTGALRHTAAFSGFGQSRLFRGPDVPLGDLAVEASLAAIADAGLTLDQVDGVVCTPDAPFSRGRSADGSLRHPSSAHVEDLEHGLRCARKGPRQFDPTDGGIDPRVAV